MESRKVAGTQIEECVLDTRGYPCDEKGTGRLATKGLRNWQVFSSQSSMLGPLSLIRVAWYYLKELNKYRFLFISP